MLPGYHSTHLRARRQLRALTCTQMRVCWLTMSKPLLTEIEECRAATGLGKHRFGILAANNGRLIERLEACARRGRSPRLAPETIEAIRAFMAQVSQSGASE